MGVSLEKMGVADGAIFVCVGGWVLRLRYVWWR